MPNTRFDNPSRRAFTLIEMIVVIIIIGVAAALVMPRAFDGAAKRGEQTARSVASMLTAVSQRDATAFDPMLIVYSREEASLEVRVMRERDGDRVWRTDLFIDGVSLDDAALRSASVDGYPLDSNAWSIEIPVNTPRPVIELVVAMDAGRDSRAWRITLAPGASAARLTDFAAGIGTNEDAPLVVDLDVMGMQESAW